MLDILNILVSVLTLAGVLALHVVWAPPRPRAKKPPKHLRPYDELRLTNL